MSYKGFSEAELELVDTLMNEFGASREHAEEHIIAYKRQLVVYYLQEKQFEVAKMLKSQIEQYEKERLLIFVPK